MKIAIIGSGISGLSIANMLHKEHEVIVFEQNKKPGGLIKCERVQDCLFHKVGGHVFNSKNEAVLNWFWKHFDRDNEFVLARRSAKILFDDKIIGYPIENYLYTLDKDLAKKVIAEMIDLNKNPKLSPFEYDNFEDFLKYNFGETLYNLYFGPYNHKIWRTDLSQVAMEWLEGKLPMPNLLDMLMSNIVQHEETDMVHARFYYPKENGSQFIIDRLSQNINIKTNTTISTTQKTNGKYTVDKEEGFDHVVYCGDIRKIPQEWKSLMQQKNVDINYLENLRSNGTSNLFCETDDNTISWLYIPSPSIKAHRIIYTGNFSNTNNRGVARKTCVVEFSGEVNMENHAAGNKITSR